MREGLLWFDDDPRRRLAEKIELAAARYRQKFGVAPDTCYVSSSAGELAGITFGERLRVLPSTTIRPHHFWIGRDSGENPGENEIT
jgi:hypothetical protein